MAVNPTYPGVYIQEVPSGVRTIVGVSTSITAFIGRTLRGPENDPVRIGSYAEYTRIFGGLWAKSTLSYAVQQYFLNGGSEAIIVRVTNTAAAAAITLTGPAGDLVLTGANKGGWTDNLQAMVDHLTSDKDDPSPELFNLTIREVDSDGNVVNEETFRNLSVKDDHKRYVKNVLLEESSLVVVTSHGTQRPDETLDMGGDYTFINSNGMGDDGIAVTENEITEGATLEDDREGLWALEDTDIFNLLCIPPFERTTDVSTATWSKALKYCKDRRAFLIVDPPSNSPAPNWKKPADVTDGTNGVDSLNLRDENAAIYYPRIKMNDPLQENRLQAFSPCGVVAGIFARTDAARGVWKAPAGLDATLSGVRELEYKMTDKENGQLNPEGVNCLRTMPAVGHVLWGARTLEGADRLASEWKYVPVRRLALYIEESLYRGTQWAVFEPNDEPLWAQLRLNIGAFMHNLFRQGAFQGSTPKEAYFVKCDRSTTTQNDIDRGIVNIMVGFAPLKPAEFVILHISQIAGQVAA